MKNGLFGARKRVIEYRTTTSLRLLILPKGSNSTLEVKDSKMGTTPTKEQRDPMSKIKNIIEAENLDGWVDDKVVCLRDWTTLRLIDDDKKTGLSQQLLTDMFTKLDISRS
eukprot:CAMPEP_0170177822 /NCGR_PEP_ID=MMETSP0040_2-20121228/11131_1 /TAXON_ID=641309 /ORGANISM="Lotharella oceanica, Strain CCMP622" /LENGTH=110 /DNA_ID=CAMNT_0010420629 /DNA_START=251 /DNA_END=583 /DNA_ORIENTATION=+